MLDSNIPATLGNNIYSAIGYGQLIDGKRNEHEWTKMSRGWGASAGAIFQVKRAFQFQLKSTIEEEKQLQDVNVILGESSEGLAIFGKGLFQIAQRTAQSINPVSDAATELARQGLST